LLLYSPVKEWGTWGKWGNMGNMGKWWENGKMGENGERKLTLTYVLICGKSMKIHKNCRSCS